MTRLPVVVVTGVTEVTVLDLGDLVEVDHTGFAVPVAVGRDLMAAGSRVGFVTADRALLGRMPYTGGLRRTFGSLPDALSFRERARVRPRAWQGSSVSLIIRAMPGSAGSWAAGRSGRGPRWRGRLATPTFVPAIDVAHSGVIDPAAPVPEVRPTIPRPLAVVPWPVPVMAARPPVAGWWPYAGDSGNARLRRHPVRARWCHRAPRLRPHSRRRDRPGRPAR